MSWFYFISDTCLFLNKRHSRVDSINCSHFTNGCPYSPYYSYKIFDCKSQVFIFATLCNTWRSCHNVHAYAVSLKKINQSLEGLKEYRTLFNMHCKRRVKHMYVYIWQPISDKNLIYYLWAWRLGRGINFNFFFIKWIWIIFWHAL